MKQASPPSTGRIAVGYVRRSFVSPGSPGFVSREVQTQAIERLAPGAQVFEDFGVSGSDRHTRKRKQYAAMRELIEQGRVSKVVAYSLSRLARSVREIADLAALCRLHDVALVTEAESLDTGNSASGALLLHLMAAVAEFESSIAAERTRAALAVKKAKGQPHGEAPFGYQHVETNGTWQTIATGEANAVVAAYKATGSYYGAARQLTADGVPTKRGLTQWTPSSVQRVIRHAAPEAMPTAPSPTSKRRKATGDPLSRLVLCWCGRVMTPANRRVNGHVLPSMYCSAGRTDPKHGRAWLGSKDRTKLMTLIEAEASKYAPPKAVVALKNQTANDRQRLEKKRAALIDMLADGILNKADAKARIAEVDEALALNTRAEQGSMDSIGIPATGVDFTAPGDEVGSALRQMFVSVQVTRDYAGATFRWALPDAWHDVGARQALEQEEAEAVAAYESEVTA